jgi:hypothetical protein
MLLINRQERANLSCSQIQIFSRRSRCNGQSLGRKNQLLSNLFGIILLEHACAKRVDLGKEGTDALDIGWARHSFFLSLILRTIFDTRMMCLCELRRVISFSRMRGGLLCVPSRKLELGIGNKSSSNIRMKSRMR